MNFLLTNDDGYQSEKLQFTRDILSKFGTVYMVAPKIEQSAKGMSLTIGGFCFEKLDDYNYIIEGTPVDCVNFAYEAIDIDFDLVVSGTNNGYNIGIDTRYSGTVGACLQAQYHGYASLALSADNKGNAILKQELEIILRYVLDNRLYSTDYTLNVNFPRDYFSSSKGIKHTTIQYYKFKYTPVIENGKFKPHRSYIEDENLVEGSDAWAYIHGYTSISKIIV